MARALDDITDLRALIQGFFDDAPTGYQILDATGASRHVNQAFRDMFGSEPPPGYSVFEDETIVKLGFATLIRRAFAGEKIEVPAHWYDPRELRHVQVDGKRVGVTVTMFPLPDATGAIEHIGVCFKDVTAELARQEEQERHRESEALKASVMETATDAILIADAGGAILDANTAAERIFRCAKAALVGRELEHLLGAVGEPMVRALRRPDGTTFSAEVVIAPSSHADSAMLFAYVHDVTERENAMAALATSEARYRAADERMLLAQDVADVGMFELTLATGELRWTPALERMHGLAAGTFGCTRAAWATLLHPDDRAAAEALVERVLATTEAVEGEWRVVRPDGSVRWLVSRFRAMFADGRPQRVVGANVDITARKHAEDEARRLNETLEKLVHERTAELTAANRELESFSYSIAHDLRAPLRAMRGFSAVLLEEAVQLDEQEQKHLQRIHANAVLLSDRIDALLALARLGRGEVRRQCVDISDLGRTILAELAQAHPDRRVEVHVEPALTAEADPALLRTALENLLHNAWKFTARTPEAKIAVGAIAAPGGRPTFFVRDNGAGFDMHHASELFVPFQRLHPATEYPGTGIGLATVQRIVERHNGAIWAEAAVGQGATFFFKLAE